MQLRRRCLQIIAALVALPYIVTPFYGVINPPSLAILTHQITGKRAAQDWQSLSAISPWMVRAVIVAEDSAFCQHHGIDTGAMEKAFEKAVDRGYPTHGASTIPMQTAKNLFLWMYPGFIRKPLEIPLALWMDAVLGKRRIMEIYLNVAQTGDGIYGASAAATHYFGVNARYLSADQASKIAASLPNPSQRPANALGWAVSGYHNTILARSPQADMSCFIKR